MKVIRGDLWCEVDVADLLLVSTNAIVNRNGHLVMGRGAALQAKERFPGLAFCLASRLKEVGERRGVTTTGPHGKYGIATLCGCQPEAWGLTHTILGAFQVKYCWQDQADLDLIRYSAQMLAKGAGIFDRIVMNMPGVGNGRLSMNKVLPILEAELSSCDNLYVYYR